MTGLSRFVTEQSKAIIFITFALCLAGIYAGLTMPTSVFPQTDFPRVVILVDSGVMPAEQMMATITRPIEEAINDIPGVTSIRSATSRGSAEINVFFNWQVDMVQSLLFVQGRLSQLASQLPANTTTQVYRLTFSSFPIIGISLTSQSRDMAALWEMARYQIKPRLTRVPGVARVDLVGGRVPEYHVAIDPVKLEAYNLSFSQVVDALRKTNLITSAGMLDENHQLYLLLLSGQVKESEKLGETVVSWSNQSPIFLRDIATVRPGVQPQYNIVTADGVNAVLLNIRSQPEASTIAVADGLNKELEAIRREIPPDMKLAFFYDQSLLVHQSIRSVWESIIIGLLLSILILYLFLKNWGTSVVATVVIPVTVLVTLIFMKLIGLSFNLMTLGGIAAAIGLVIDDAIVVVENIFTKVAGGLDKRAAIELAVAEITPPIIGSTLTPVVVFIPLAFLDGVPGVFFRALALTMVAALLTSLILALTLTPTLALRFVGPASAQKKADEVSRAGRIFAKAVAIYEQALSIALKHQWKTITISLIIAVMALVLYRFVDTDFLPAQDEGAFVLDYFTPPGTSLSETNRILGRVERFLVETPEIESYSRRTGARLALAIAEPNTGDFLVKLKANRSRSVEEITDELRKKIESSEPALHVEFAGILNDLIGDLTWSPAPIEIKVFSSDQQVIKEKAMQIASIIEGIPGVVDVFHGVVITGPALTLKVDSERAARIGMSTEDVARAVNTALLGDAASYILQGDRAVTVRVVMDERFRANSDVIRKMLIRSPSGITVPLDQIADVRLESGQTELRREDLRQTVAVRARLSGRDLGSAMREIQEKVNKQVLLLPGTSLEYGGFYKQQQESFRNLLFVLLMAILLVFIVLVIEFRSFLHPLSIVFGAVLSLFGVLAALILTRTSFNIISFMGAIIGIGIVAKNGILMLDFVDHLIAEGAGLTEALVQSGRRRIRPVVMTSLAAALGMLPLAFGVGSGAQMLRPLAIAVIGGLCISVLFSLVATPTMFQLLKGSRARGHQP